MDNACKIERIAVELTERCNNACLHCYNYWRGTPALEPRNLSRADVRGLIAKVRRDSPLIQVALSGGEPLLNAETPEIVCDLADAGLGAVVITNAVLLTDSRLARFPRGSVFEVTLFSADAALHDCIAGRPVFRRVLEALVRIERHRCKFVLACVVNRLNAHDVTRTIELGIALGADGVLFNRMNLCRHTFQQAHELVPKASALRESLEAANTAAAKYGITVSVSVPVPPCVVDPGDFPHLQFGWCPRGNDNAYYTISARGELRPCNHASLVLGDLYTSDFGAIIASHKTARFWGAAPRECRNCAHPLREQCRGGCPAAAYECYGSADRMDPFVQFATGHSEGMTRQSLTPTRQPRSSRTVTYE